MKQPTDAEMLELANKWLHKEYEDLHGAFEKVNELGSLEPMYHRDLGIILRFISDNREAITQAMKESK